LTKEHRSVRRTKEEGQAIKKNPRPRNIVKFQELRRRPNNKRGTFESRNIAQFQELRTKAK